MNVIRMIKVRLRRNVYLINPPLTSRQLFGWEPRTQDQLAEKREEELVYQKKFKLLELLNGNVKYVFFAAFN
jgi:hypothetical protein